jgi:hypothetical protein
MSDIFQTLVLIIVSRNKYEFPHFTGEEYKA